MVFIGKTPIFYTPQGYNSLMEDYKPKKRTIFKVVESVYAKKELYDYPLQHR